MEQEICKALNAEERHQLQQIEKKILYQCEQMEIQRKRQEVRRL